MNVSFNASRPVKMFQYRGDDQQQALNVYKATSGPAGKKCAESNKHGSFYTDWYAQRIKVMWKEAEEGQTQFNNVQCHSLTRTCCHSQDDEACFQIHFLTYAMLIDQ